MKRLFNSLQKYIKIPACNRLAGPIDFLRGDNFADDEWKRPLLFAVGIHLFVALAALSSPIFFQRTSRIPEVYTVTLYSAPPKVSTPAPVIKAPSPIKVAKPIVPKFVKPANIVKPKAVSLKPLRAKLKKQQEEKEKERKQLMLASKLNRIKNQIKKQEADKAAKAATQNAVNKLADLYRSRQNAKDASQQVVSQPPVVENTSGPVGNIDSGVRLEALARYKALLFQHIHQHWTLPDLQNWDNSLEAVIVVLARRDGTVINSYFDKRSDDINFNREVEKAIRQSAPLPPFPPELTKDEEELVITFFPSGML